MSESPTGDDAAAIVRVESVRKTFGETVALDDVSLEVKRGEMFALLGASGSGKTSLLRLLAGFDQPDRGRILIDGRDMTAVPPYERPVNMMFQSYALFPHMSVEENVAFGLRQESRGARPSGPEIRERTQEALELVRLGGYESRRPHQLSGGEQQRVALARAIVKRPKLLLLDEPLAALDRKLREATQIELVRIQAQTGIAFVIVTHDQDEAMSLSDRLAVLHAGRVLQVGPPRQIYEFPSSVYVADFIGAANLFRGSMTSVGDEGAHVTCSELPAPLLVAEPPPGVRTGQTLHVAVRPERIVVEPTGSADAIGSNEAGGTIRDVAFLGNQSRLTVELASGKLVSAVRLNPGEAAEALRPGSRVRLRWAARDCRGLVS
jgi:putrescine transport system ATP-binding protein